MLTKAFVRFPNASHSKTIRMAEEEKEKNDVHDVMRQCRKIWSVKTTARYNPPNKKSQVKKTKNYK